MPKKLKLNLKDLKVQSFVTSLDETQKSKLKGEGPNTNSDIETACDIYCPTACGSHCMTDCTYPPICLNC